MSMGGGGSERIIGTLVIFTAVAFGKGGATVHTLYSTVHHFLLLGRVRWGFLCEAHYRSDAPLAVIQSISVG